MRILFLVFVLSVLIQPLSAVRKHKHVDKAEKEKGQRRATESESGSSDEYDREVNINSDAASGEEARQPSDNNVVESPENIPSTSSAPPPSRRRRQPETSSPSAPPVKQSKVHHQSDETTHVVSNFENY